MNDLFEEFTQEIGSTDIVPAGTADEICGKCFDTGFVHGRQTLESGDVIEGIMYDRIGESKVLHKCNCTLRYAI